LCDYSNIQLLYFNLLLSLSLPSSPTHTHISSGEDRYPTPVSLNLDPVVWAEHFKNNSKCKRLKQKKKRKAKSKALVAADRGTQQLQAQDDSVVGQHGGKVERTCEEEEEGERWSSYGEEKTGGFIHVWLPCYQPAGA